MHYKAVHNTRAWRGPSRENGVAPDFVKLLLVLAADGLALAVDLGVGGDNAVGLRLRLHHLELHAAHASAYQEHVVLRAAATQHTLRETSSCE